MGGGGLIRGGWEGGAAGGVRKEVAMVGVGVQNMELGGGRELVQEEVKSNVRGFMEGCLSSGSSV